MRRRVGIHHSINVMPTAAGNKTVVVIFACKLVSSSSSRWWPIVNKSNQKQFSHNAHFFPYTPRCNHCMTVPPLRLLKHHQLEGPEAIMAARPKGEASPTSPAEKGSSAVPPRGVGGRVNSSAGVGGGTDVRKGTMKWSDILSGTQRRSNILGKTGK